MSKWAIHIHGDMPRYVNEQGNVAILGDAVRFRPFTSFIYLTSKLTVDHHVMMRLQAHAMETHLGTGAGQAMEVHSVTFCALTSSTVP